MRMLLVAASHGRGMVERMRSLQNDYGVNNLDVYECWVPGATIAFINDKFQKELAQIRLHDPVVALIHISHNNLAKSEKYNPKPDLPKLTMDELWAFSLFMRDVLPKTKVLVSSPWPRVEARYSPEDFVYNYNSIASNMLQYLRSLARKMVDRGIEPLTVIDTPELWLSSSARKGNPEFFKFKDGLHLNELGVDLIARKWLSILADPTIIVLPPRPGPKGPPKRKQNKKRGGRKAPYKVKD